MKQIRIPGEKRAVLLLLLLLLGVLVPPVYVLFSSFPPISS